MKLYLALVLLGIFAYTECRDLSITVLGGQVENKDTFSSDPYLSVSVCSEKNQTPTLASTMYPEWNWTHVFTNVDDQCRIKFHLYDYDMVSDDTIGIVEMDSLAQFMAEGAEERTLFFGSKGESQIKIRIKYVY